MQHRLIAPGGARVRSDPDDLDRFKCVDDSLGYDVGGLLLKTTALRLRAIVRSSGLVARLGGDV